WNDADDAKKARQVAAVLLRRLQHDDGFALGDGPGAEAAAIRSVKTFVGTIGDGFGHASVLMTFIEHQIKRPIDCAPATAPNLALALGSLVVVLALGDQDRPLGAAHGVTLQSAIGGGRIRAEVLGGFEVVERTVFQVSAAQAGGFAAGGNEH